MAGTLNDTPFRLDGKVALVTGAGSGIGEQIARLYARQGAAVVIGDRDEAGGTRVAAAIAAAGGRALSAARRDRRRLGPGRRGVVP